MTRHRFFVPFFSSAFLLIMSVIAPVQLPAQEKAVQDSTILTYEEDLRWVLVRTCFDCHSGTESKGGLHLDSYEAVMAGGENGPAVVPGSPEKSILYQKLLPDPPFGKMMPRKKDLKLSEYELTMIRTWIEQGALMTRSAPDSAR